MELPEGESRGGETVWPPEVFQFVCENVNRRFADLLRALAWTGARPSTLRRIEAKHYNPRLKVWDVEEIYAGRKSRKKIVTRIWLSPPMVEMVEGLNAEHPEGPIFRNSYGRPWTTSASFVRFETAREKKVIRKQVTPYAYRHAWATHALENGSGRWGDHKTP